MINKQVYILVLDPGFENDVRKRISTRRLASCFHQKAVTCTTSSCLPFSTNVRPWSGSLPFQQRRYLPCRPRRCPRPALGCRQTLVKYINIKIGCNLHTLYTGSRCRYCHTFKTVSVWDSCSSFSSKFISNFLQKGIIFYLMGRARYTDYNFLAVHIPRSANNWLYGVRTTGPRCNFDPLIYMSRFNSCLLLYYNPLSILRV